jgi:hypothetical protein
VPQPARRASSCRFYYQCKIISILKLADRWKTRTRDNVRHILTPADIDFILGDLIRSARTTDITENQGSAIIMMYNVSVAANSEKKWRRLRSYRPLCQYLGKGLPPQHAVDRRRHTTAADR